MPVTNGNLNEQASNTFFMHALEALSKGRLEVERPELLYAMTFPMESWDMGVESGNEYVSKFVDDWSGQAKIRARDSIDVPTMGMTTQKLTVQLFDYSISNALDDKTIQQSKILSRGGFSPDVMERMPKIANSAMKEAYERMLIFGDTIQDSAAAPHYPGFINNPNVDIATAAGQWATLDPEQIIADIQSALVAVIENSNTVSYANTILLPISQYNLIATTKAGARANDETILNYVRTQGLSPAASGGTIDIYPYRYLSEAGGAGVDRMIAYEKKPKNFFIANPVDFQIVRVIPTPYGMQYSYRGEISNLLIPYPNSMLYHDGI